MKLIRAVALLCAIALAGACGGTHKDGVTAKVAAKEADVDADPLALLPGAAVVVGNVDARAFFASATLGAQLAQMVEKMVPIGDEAGFVASRDLDRAYFAVYSTQGADAAAVLSGKFDEVRVRHMVETHAPSKGGGFVVSSTYAGRTLYTINNAGFVILSPRTALVGTEAGMRRALDRIRDGRARRDILPWMVETVGTPGAAAAIAADFTNQPIAAAGMGALPLGWLQGMKSARVLFSFREPGVNAAASLTYPDPNQAAAAAEQVRRTGNLTSLFALVGLPQLRNMQVGVEKSDVQVSFGVDDQSLRGLLANLPRWMGQP